MLKKGVFLATSTALLVAVFALTLRILCSEENVTAGLLTLKSGANSLFGVAAARASDAADHVQSAVNSATSSAASSAAAFLQGIEEHVPQNCSLGTRRFCVGYKLDLRCSGLPFNLSSLLPDVVRDLPDPIESTIRERVDALSPLADSLAQFPVFYLPNTLIAGLVLVAVLTSLSIWLALDRLSRVAVILQKLNIGLRVPVVLVVGLVCCVPSMLLAFMVRTLVQKAEGLPSWVEVEEGEAGRLSFGVLGCALVLAVLAGAPTVAVL
ncbi:hypothetical protein BS50DRAFT_682398 [Corynespora cassiicola Philippines]|uniref:Uncharacterized protein n=1 Tax=Corynespora cassiicola Philippines TaxID=1448308 RepID=A0A2T2N1H4_CORCC|nr:hypothetical protein BS50DRAFT_682398 [Corynespora cassiicola Philippines]